MTDVEPQGKVSSSSSVRASEIAKLTPPTCSRLPLARLALARPALALQAIAVQAVAVQAVAVQALAIQALAGCSAQRLVLPEPPSLDSKEPSLDDVAITVALSVHGKGPRDFEDGEAALLDSLAAYLRSKGPFESVSRDRPAIDGDLVPILVRATLELDSSHHRTWILDVLAAYPFLGLFPLTPEWGEARVRLRLEAFVQSAPDDPSGVWISREEIPVVEVDVRAAFSSVTYSWYRTDPEEDAFRRAYARAFEDVAERLRKALLEPVERLRPRLRAERTHRPRRPASTTEPKHLELVERGRESKCRRRVPGGGFGSLVLRPWVVAVECSDASTRTSTRTSTSTRTALAAASAERGRSVGASLDDPLGAESVQKTSTVVLEEAPPPEFLVAADPPVQVQKPVVQALEPVERLESFIDEEGFRVLVRPVERSDASLFERYLMSLGGLEVSAFKGIASVSTRIRTPGHPDELVGSGAAASTGYRVSLFKPPDRTGFFFPGTVGFLSEDVRIDGFLEDIPVVDVTGAETIGARVSDPNTGQEDYEAINYDLRLRSGFVTQSLALNLVLGDEDVQFFATGRVGINVLELRHLGVQFFDGSEEVTDLRAFMSGSAGAQLGLAIPSLHAALRGAVDFEWYDRFEYPTRIDFLTRATYSPSQKIYVRERAWADAVSLTAWNAQVSGVVLF